MGTRRDLPLRLPKLRLAGELAEIRAGQLRFTEDETRELLAAAGIALPGHVAACGWRSRPWTCCWRGCAGTLSASSSRRARAALAALDDRQAAIGEIRNAAVVICLAEQDPAAARRQLRPVLHGTAPVFSCLTLVEAHLLDALACRDLGDEGASREAVERALSLAEPDRLVLPFAMTGAWELLEALPSQGKSRAALVADILGGAARR